MIFILIDLLDLNAAHRVNSIAWNEEQKIKM